MLITHEGRRRRATTASISNRTAIFPASAAIHLPRLRAHGSTPGLPLPARSASAHAQIAFSAHAADRRSTSLLPGQASRQALFLAEMAGLSIRPRPVRPAKFHSHTHGCYSHILSAPGVVRNTIFRTFVPPSPPSYAAKKRALCRGLYLAKLYRDWPHVHGSMCLTMSQALY